MGGSAFPALPSAYSLSEAASRTAHPLFGGVLQSEISLPSLPTLDSDRADWSVRISEEAPASAAEFLGEERVNEAIRVRTARLPGGFRLDFDDTGTFDITASGTLITWHPNPSARQDLARADLLGGVFAVALHLQGVLCLHGSGVAIGDDAIGFLAAKGSGKSTLALALSVAGAQLITDDMLAVHPGPPAEVWPASPEVHLLEDSAGELRRRNSGDRNSVRGKYRVANLPSSGVTSKRCRLAALYELSPRDSLESEHAARRVRLPDGTAVMRLLRHPKIGESLGRVERMATFDRAARVARQVPIYRLEIAHDFSRLPEAVRQIMSWHGAEPSLPDGG